MVQKRRKQFEIIIAGVGGQGNVSCGIIIGEAASCYEGKFVTMTSTYGTEARGTFTRTDVLIGDNFIDFYECKKPDAMLILHNKAYLKIKNQITPDTLVVVNQNEVEQVDTSLGHTLSLPLSDLAFKIGSLQVINVISLAFMVQKTGFIKRISLEKAVLDKYAQGKIAELNRKALELGFNLA